jgi:hypothetical protein
MPGEVVVALLLLFVIAGYGPLYQEGRSERSWFLLGRRGTVGNGAEFARSREAGHLFAWGDVYELLSRADESRSLPGDDLELLAAAAYLLGRADECRRALQSAHRAHVAAGDARRATRCVFWVAFTLLLEGSLAQSSGWLARAHRLLEPEKEECAEHGLLLLPAAVLVDRGGIVWLLYLAA